MVIPDSSNSDLDQIICIPEMEAKSNHLLNHPVHSLYEKKAILFFIFPPVLYFNLF